MPTNEHTKPLYRYHGWYCQRCLELGRKGGPNIYETCIRCRADGVLVKSTTKRDMARAR